MPKLSLAKLERHLYGAADILRREGMDAATYKDFIFGILFLKRCSDVFEADYEKIVQKKISQGIEMHEAQAHYGEIVTGRTPPASEPVAWGNEIPFITPAEITTDETVLPSERLISSHGKNFSRELPAYSVLVVCIGSTLGKVAVTPWQSVTNQQINAIICKVDYHHGFVSSMINHHIRQLHRWAGLQAVPIVNKSQFGRMLIPIAPPTEQVQIAETLQRSESNILSEVNECQKLNKLKFGLQEELLTGRVRVPESIMKGAAGV
jgi:hypothetical protein